jgi:hypothetical protein
VPHWRFAHTGTQMGSHCPALLQILPPWQSPHGRPQTGSRPQTCVPQLGMHSFGSHWPLALQVSPLLQVPHDCPQTGSGPHVRIPQLETHAFGSHWPAALQLSPLLQVPHDCPQTESGPHTRLVQSGTQLEPTHRPSTSQLSPSPQVPQDVPQTGSRPHALSAHFGVQLAPSGATPRSVQLGRCPGFPCSDLLQPATSTAIKTESRIPTESINRIPRHWRATAPVCLGRFSSELFPRNSGSAIRWAPPSAWR